MTAILVNNTVSNFLTGRHICYIYIPVLAGYERNRYKFIFINSDLHVYVCVYQKTRPHLLDYFLNVVAWSIEIDPFVLLK